MSLYSTSLNLKLPAAPEAGVRDRVNIGGQWEELGPGNIGGRTRALLIDPGSPAVMYAAGVAGGIWKSIDAGTSWIPIGDLLPNLAVSSLAMDPKNSAVLYAGTGEGFFNADAIRGAGIFKSVNGGLNWSRLAATDSPDFNYVNDIVISPVDSARVYAATRSGVWFSGDGGATWGRVLDPGSSQGKVLTGGCLDLAIRTDTASDYIFASCGTFDQAAIWRNTDAAGTGAWVMVHTEAGMGRTSLAIAPSNQNVVYAASASYQEPNLNGLHAVFRSTVSGQAGSWTAQVRSTDPDKLNRALFSNPILALLQDCGFGPSRTSNQGWYDNVIAADPKDENRVWVGGIDLFRSDDGGINWGLASHWWIDPGSPAYAHADHHVIVFHPGFNGTTNRIMFTGNDGGIFRTDDSRAAVVRQIAGVCNPPSSGVAWTSLNNNYGVTQFYHGTVLPDGTAWFGGTQDNGTIFGDLNTGQTGWREILGGDGGYVAVDEDAPKVLYAETTRLSFRKSTDGGVTFSSAIQGIEEPPENFIFIAPYVMDPSDSRRLWIGGRALWRTDNAGANWRRAGISLDAGQTFASVSAVAVAAGNANLVIAGTTSGWIHRTDQGSIADDNTIWPGAHPRTGYVSSLTFDPQNPVIAYATYSTFGGVHVWRSLDAGASWMPLDGSGAGTLPDVPVHSLVIDPANTAILYIGTDLGVFTSIDGGSTWSVENTGFPATVVETLRIHTRDGVSKLYAFTHGRGVWRVSLPGVGCSYRPSRNSLQFSASGGQTAVNITATPASCQVQAQSLSDWISVMAGNQLMIVAAANPEMKVRTGVVSFGGRSVVVRQDAAYDNLPPTLSITSPSSGSVYLTDAATVSLAGIAADDRTLGSVLWSNDRGGYGVANGSSNWTISSIGLLIGVNNITVAAFDSSGNRTDSFLTVIYKPIALQVYAGGGNDSIGEGVPAKSAYSYAKDVALDSSGNLYISELSRVRRVTTDGLIRTIAGTNESGFSGDGGPATRARFHTIDSIALDKQGNLYIADSFNGRVRKVTPDGIINTIAGNGMASSGNAEGDGGPAVNAPISPVGLAVSPQGELFLTDIASNRIRRLSNQGVITTFAGGGTGGDGGPATAARLNNPRGIAFDLQGNLYIAEESGGLIRRVDAASGVITTVAGGGSRFNPQENVPATTAYLNGPWDVTVDDFGNLYITDKADRRIKRVNLMSGLILTVAGGGSRIPGDGVPATSAGFDFLYGITSDPSGLIYFCEPDRGKVHRLLPAAADSTPPVINIISPTPNTVITGQNRITITGTANDDQNLSHVVWFNDRTGMGLAGGSSTWIVDQAELKLGENRFTIKVWDIGGNASTAVVNITYNPGPYLNRIGGGGDRSLLKPETVAFDNQGELFVVDTGHHRIHRMARDGSLGSFAGTGEVGATGDGGAAVSATFNSPAGLAFDANGNAYIADTNNHRIRKAGKDGKLTAFAGNGIAGFNGDGGPAAQASLDTPVGLAVRNGYLYIADAGNHRIRRIDLAGGTISTVAGNGFGVSEDGVAAASAGLAFPTSIAFDATGNLIISETGANRIRKVTTGGIITTIAGTILPGFGGDGGPAISAHFSAPGGLAFDGAGNLYIADQLNHRIRRIDTGGKIETIAGTGTPGTQPGPGLASLAQLNAPAGMSIDSAGNLYIADTANDRVLVLTSYRAQFNLSAASYAVGDAAPESIIASFGSDLAARTEEASSVPLPTVLGGSGVRVRDSQGAERAAPLFFVSRNQVNYQIPPGCAPGPAVVTVTTADGVVSTGAVNIRAVSPGLFSANADGQGVAAALALRLKSDGTQIYEPVFRFEQPLNRFVAVPIDPGPESDQLFLILFGTGIRGRSNQAAVRSLIGGVECEVLYASAQGELVGLDQINLRLPRTLVGRGVVDVSVTVDGYVTNTLKIEIR